VFELFVEKSRAAFARINGVSAYRILIFEQSRLGGLKLYPSSPFNVFISDANTWESVESFRLSSELPLLHVTTANGIDIPKLVTLGRAELKELYDRVMDFLHKSGEPEMVLLPKPGQQLVNWDVETLGLPERCHGATVPNEMALKSMRYELGELDPLPAFAQKPDGLSSANANSHIVGALRASVEAVRTPRSHFLSLRRAPPAGPPIDTVIWAAGIASHLQEAAPRNASASAALIPVLRALLRQRDYPGFTNVSQAFLKNMLASDEAKTAVTMRKFELELSAGAIGVLAAGNFAPVIRIRPAVNLVRGQMRQLAACAAANGPRRMSKLSKLTHDLGDHLAKEIGEDCMDMIERAAGGIKLVSNAPLEFLSVRGLPLQLRRTVSRLPVTPGSVFLSHLIGIPDLHLSPSDLKAVLITRCFKDRDPIKNVLSIASQEFLAQAAGKLDVKIVDVRSTAEFVQALNSFSGQILIFDGHGSHDAREDTGFLQLGEDSVYPLELAGKINRMPPIVVLSACSTHPLEWSDGSIANGFLMLGAISVLATVTPISAVDAAIFTGRLMLRLADFVPLVAGSGYRWSDVITGLLRMAYVTDMLRSFEKRGWLSAEMYREIQFQANMGINSGKSDWFEEVLSSSSKKMAVSSSEVESFWRGNTYFTSALQYIHLGSPEKIVIVEDDDENSSAPTSGMSSQ
jgi:hypothetical protein